MRTPERPRTGGLVDEVPLPALQPGQVRAEVLACGICGSDLHALHHADRMVEMSELTAEPGLRERAFGVMEGHTYEDIEQRWPEFAARWKARDPGFAALISDLKTRGLLEKTLVVWMGEFGRTPFLQGSIDNTKQWGRDHHPYTFTVWMAGGGLKRGVVHGATDEIGFHAVEHRHYVTDIHATILRQLGLDSRRLEVPGRKRLEIDHGVPIAEIIA